MSHVNLSVYVHALRNMSTPKYDREELAIIKPYKKKYLAAKSPARRRYVIVGELCVELFNFWVISCGAAFSDLAKKNRVEVCQILLLLSCLFLLIGSIRTFWPMCVIDGICRNLHQMPNQHSELRFQILCGSGRSKRLLQRLPD